MRNGRRQRRRGKRREDRRRRKMTRLRMGHSNSRSSCRSHNHSRWALVAPPEVCEVWPLTLKMAMYKEVACKAVPQVVKRVNMSSSSSRSTSRGRRRTRRASRFGGTDSNIMYSMVGWSLAWKLEGAGTGMVRGSRLSLLTSYSRLKQLLRPRPDALYHCCFSVH